MSICRPLHCLLEKGVHFNWTTDCQQAFDSLHSHLTSPPILAFPDFSKEFILDTDASDTGLGAVLSQLHDDGREWVVTYASCALSKTERNYSVTCLLAVVAFVSHFRPYLLGTTFKLRTDHNSLKWLHSFKQPEGQVARWLEKLAEFSFTIEHRPGRTHGNADSLSRSLPAFAFQIPLLEQTMADMRNLQLQDETIGPVLHAKDSKTRPSDDSVVHLSTDSHRLFQLWDQMTIENGVLIRLYVTPQGDTPPIKQLVVPKSLRDNILDCLHAGVAGGHLGQAKTLSKLKARFYWPGHYKDVEYWCRTCPDCASCKMPTPHQKAPLSNVAVGSPMQMVAIDLLGPFPTSPAGNKYLLVAVDYFTKWVEAYPLPNMETTTVPTALVNEMFFRFSPLEQLHLDQG